MANKKETLRDIKSELARVNKEISEATTSITAEELKQLTQAKELYELKLKIRNAELESKKNADNIYDVSKLITQSAKEEKRIKSTSLKIASALSKLETAIKDSKTSGNKAQQTILERQKKELENVKKINEAERERLSLGDDLIDQKKMLSEKLTDQINKIPGGSLIQKIFPKQIEKATNYASKIFDVAGVAKYAAGIAAVAGVATIIYNKFNNMRDAAIDTSREMGITADEAWKFNGNIAKSALNAVKLGANLGHSLNDMISLQREFSDVYQTNLQLSTDSYQSGAYLMKNMNLTAKEAVKFQEVMAISNTDIQSGILGLKDGVDLINQQTNMGLRLNDVMKSISDISLSTLANYKRSNTAILKGIQILSKYGTTWETTKTSASGLLNIEQSIGDEIEARILTQKNVNLDQARYLAFLGKNEEALDNIIKQLGSYESLERMLPIQRESYAKLLNVTDDQLLKMVSHQKVMSTLTEQNIKDLQGLTIEQINANNSKISGLTKEQKAEYLANRTSTKASELTATAMTKLSLWIDSMAADNKGDLRKRYSEAGLNYDTPQTVNDTLIRPGLPPIKFNKDDLILAGTNLTGQAPSAPSNNNSEVVALLKQLIQKIDQPVNFTIGNRVIAELDDVSTIRRTFSNKIDSGYGTFG